MLGGCCKTHAKLSPKTSSRLITVTEKEIPEEVVIKPQCGLDINSEQFKSQLDGISRGIRRMKTFIRQKSIYFYLLF